MPTKHSRIPWGEHPFSSPRAAGDAHRMKKPKHWSQPTTRVHESKDDRARTLSGKSASRKVRNQARHLATLEDRATIKHNYEATTAKHHPAPM